MELEAATRKACLSSVIYIPHLLSDCQIRMHDLKYLKSRELKQFLYSKILQNFFCISFRSTADRG